MLRHVPGLCPFVACDSNLFREIPCIISDRKSGIKDLYHYKRSGVTIPDSLSGTGVSEMPAANVRVHTVDEKLNSVTHGIGTGMSIAGMVFLLLLTTINSGRSLQYVVFSLYGSCQILLYLSSALTHQFADSPGVHRVFRIMDQAAVYLLIAGTYTPVALLGMPGRWGWTVFGVVWLLAIAGILMKTVFVTGKNLLSDLLYLPMGWLIVVALKPLRTLAPEGLLKWTMLGGGLYTIGIVFYLLKKMPFSHVVWHLFVLAGGISFYVGFTKYLT
jgi:hemolysin III